MFLGDSITSAEWVHPNWREIIEYVVKEELTKALSDWKLPSWGVRCINSGFDGSTTRDWLYLLEQAVFAYNPDMVLVLGTPNDKDLKISVDEYKNNMRKVLQALSAKVTDVVYCTDLTANKPSYNESSQAYLEAVKTIFPIKNVLYVDLFNKFQSLDLNKLYTFVSTGNEDIDLKPGEFDFIHPNQLGNAYIAKFILETAFGVSFDPEKYMNSNNSGAMFPAY